MARRAGLHGGRGLLEADAAQDAGADASLQPQRRHQPARRPAVPHVPRRRYAQVAHHRHQHPRPDDPLARHRRGRADALLPARAQGSRPRPLCQHPLPAFTGFYWLLLGFTRFY